MKKFNRAEKSLWCLIITTVMINFKARSFHQGHFLKLIKNQAWRNTERD